jgi:hypothetical protein
MERDELLREVNEIKNRARHRKADKLAGIMYLLGLKIDTGKDEPVYAIKPINNMMVLDAVRSYVGG